MRGRWPGRCEGRSLTELAGVAAARAALACTGDMQSLAREWTLGGLAALLTMTAACSTASSGTDVSERDGGAVDDLDAAQPRRPPLVPPAEADASIATQTPADASTATTADAPSGEDASPGPSGDASDAATSDAATADAGAPPNDGGPGDAGPIDPATGARCGETPVSTTRYPGACNAAEFYWPDEGSGHIDPPAPLTYCTMPPNSGTHYPWVANYQTFTSPVPAGFLVHSIQHGGISLTYRCAPGADCSAVAARLQAIVDAQPADPACAGVGVKNRYVLSPAPDLDVTVAAATWDWTYRATCVDATSLQAFFDEHYGKGPEDVCEHGGTSF
jgi:hypothetical protein